MVRLVSRLTLLIAIWASAAWGQSGAEVYFMEPPDGTVVESGPWVKVTGRARDTTPQPTRAPADVMIVIDTSGSTSNPSGLRVDREGKIISSKSGSGLGWLLGSSSILDAEVAAAIQLLGVSDRTTTRVGVITFAGAYDFLTGYGVQGSKNAWLHQPLTFDYEAIHATLLDVRGRGSDGGTDMAAGLRLAIRELLGLEGAQSQPRPDARKVVLLMTDGMPTLPFGSVNVMDPGDLEVTINAARIAAKGGIVIHTFCLGPEALSAPIACIEAARTTGGLYNPVETAGDIVTILPATPIGQVELVAVRNATTGQMARSLSVSADGIFTAEVPVAPGDNRLVVELHGREGLQGTANILVHYRGADVEVEVSKERERKLEIQIERPPAREKQLDLQIERQQPVK